MADNNEALVGYSQSVRHAVTELEQIMGNRYDPLQLLRWAAQGARPEDADDLVLPVLEKAAQDTETRRRYMKQAEMFEKKTPFLETVITTSDEKTINASVRALAAFPRTTFRLARWFHGKPEDFVVLQLKMFSPAKLHMFKFYAKHADKDLTALLTPWERQRVAGIGRRLLCAVVRGLPRKAVITADASGELPWYDDELKKRAAGMADKELLRDLEENPGFVFQDDVAGGKRENLENVWVANEHTKRLVQFYKRMGFRVVREDGPFNTEVQASVADILATCGKPRRRHPR